jgi:ComF family protein
LHWLCRAVLDLLFPPRCLVCREFGPQVICETCHEAIRRITPPQCRICGLPFDPEAKAGETCAECRATRQPFAMGRAYGHYEGALRGAICRLKYDRRRAVGPTLGRSLAVCFAGAAEDGQGLPSDIEVICPVPLHAYRLRERGFNQSEVIARHLAQVLGIASAPLLVRTRFTAPQVGLPYRKREENVRGAFALSPGAEVRGRRILVLDDVWTTGATLRECARVLRRGGAGQVFLLAVARAVARPVDEA